ncbi:MAG: hypothetical protein DRH26_01830 [Deltaproteobacteria bacterium]|nr:MAG: hypothetical protein DRH26_01830 [Deltaproteobacteria bacterium]
MKESEIKIGKKVRYWEVMSFQDEFIDSEITSECWDLCGTMVCKIKGKSGGVSIEHLRERTEICKTTS